MAWKDTLVELREELTDVRAQRQARAATEEAELAKTREELMGPSDSLGVVELLNERNRTLLVGNGQVERVASWEGAEGRGVEVLECAADWKRYGGGAGTKSNRQMLDEYPDLLVAFPGGKGTADMVQVATTAGLQVVTAEEVE